MDNDNARESAGCPGPCGRCADTGAADTSEAPLVGWRLAAAAGGAFMIPLLLGLAGAAGARCVPACLTGKVGGWTGPLGSLVGCLAGLAAGVGLARLVTRRLGLRGAGTPAGK